jgi:hypothetical protein
MVQSIILGLIGVIIFWLIALTYVFIRMMSHYNKLIAVSAGANLKVVLDTLLKLAAENKKDIALLRTYCDRIEKEGHFHIQKVGLLRFNPFKDTGGDQSFILSLVDANDTGVIISGLYSRSGLRWYAKKVQNGRGVEHELSAEENKALKEAGNLDVKS